MSIDAENRDLFPLTAFQYNHSSQCFFFSIIHSIKLTLNIYLLNEIVLITNLLMLATKSHSNSSEINHEPYHTIRDESVFIQIFNVTLVLVEK